MPVPTIQQILADGLGSIPYAVQLVQVVLVGIVVYYLKRYFQGASNTSERNMHSKVVMVTGGTAGIGAEVVRGLAIRGAQIVLLTQHPLNDVFLVEYIDDLRRETGNELITAEQVDLASLYSIRAFATKWIDNAPPRRLDMVILCANTMTTRAGISETSLDGIEQNWAVNYLANFHLLSILSPALRAQPPDREVRVIVGTCASYLGGELPSTPAKQDMGGDGVNKGPAKAKQSSAYATSKLALATFAHAFQKHLSAYARPDKQPNNTRVILVDPGFSRTPGMRRYLSRGSLLGLAIYLVTYPIWWLILKSPDKGAESFLYAAMEAKYGRGEGGWLVKECREVHIGRGEIVDEAAQKSLWEYSEKMIVEGEKVAKAKAKQTSATVERTDKAPQTTESLARSATGSAATTASKRSGSSRAKKG